MQQLGVVVATIVDDEQKVRKNSSFDRLKQGEDETRTWWKVVAMKGLN